MIDEFVGKVVLVRCKGAGVHVGVLESAIVEHGAVKLRDAYRIWRWRGANTCSELAQTGASDTWTRVAVRVPVMVVIGVVEIIPVADGAVQSLTTPRWPA